MSKSVELICFHNQVTGVHVITISSNWSQNQENGAHFVSKSSNSAHRLSLTFN